MIRYFYLIIIIIIVFVNSLGMSAGENASKKEIRKGNSTNQGKANVQVPVLTVSPREIDLGSIGPNEGGRGIFILKNVGTGPLNWSINGSEGWSSLDEKKLSGVLKNTTENLKVHVSFLKDPLNSIHPSTDSVNLVQMSIESNNRINSYRKNLSFGPHREMLKLVSNGGTRNVFIRFELAPGYSEPQIGVEPARIDFGVVKMGENVTKKIKVMNKGREILRWQGAVQNSADISSPPMAGRYISFCNEDIKGIGFYTPPPHLRESIDVTGRWMEYNCYPSNAIVSNAIKYRFTGTGIAIFFTTEKNEGNVFAYVDDKYVINPDCRAGHKERTGCLIAEGLSYSTHTLTVINKGGRVIFEGVKVYGKDRNRGKPGWISIFPDSGTATKEIDYVNVMINTKQLTPGYYGEDIIFNSNGGEIIAETSVEISSEHILRIVDVYRFVAGSDYFFTSNPQADINMIRTKGYKKEGIAYRLFGSGTAGTTPFYRWYSAVRNNHFYSHDVRGDGRSLRGYVYEGAIGNIATSRLSNTRELYRWYNPSTGRHFYSTDPNGENMIKKGYRFDGIAGYVK